MSVIDAHVHLGQGKHLNLSIEDLLGQMDEAGVSLAVACPVDHYLAVHNREGNDLILEAVQRHPDRLIGMATANPWFGDAAVTELRRALNAGLSGIVIHSIYQGFRLSDPIVNPLLEVAAEFDVSVYAHSGTAGLAEPFHVAELARRFPSVNFMMGHAGSSDYYEDAVRALEFADNVWLETSRNGPANVNFWQVKKLMNRVIFGSSAPEYLPVTEIEMLMDVILDEIERRDVLSENIREVFKGKLPC